MKIMNGSDSGMNDFLLSRTLPLVNHTAVWLYTVNDFFKPVSSKGTYGYG